MNRAISERYSAKSKPPTPGIGQCYEEVAEDFNKIHEGLVETKEEDLEDAQGVYDTAVEVAWGDLDKSGERIARRSCKNRNRSDKWADLGEMIQVWLTLWHDLSLADRVYSNSTAEINSDFRKAEQGLDTQKGWADLDCILEGGGGISDSAEQNSDLPSYPPGSLESSLETIPTEPVGTVTVIPVVT